MRTCRLALVILAVLFWAGVASAQNFIYVAYQAIPGTRTGWPDIARLDYNARQRLSEDVERRILPGVVRALGLQAMALETQIVPGGYMLKTDPSFVTRFPPAEEEAALRFAAAMGYVLRQDSILIFAVDQTTGTGEFRTRTALIGSDWPGSGAGKLYIDRLAALPVEAIAPLDLLSYRFADMVRAAVR